MHRKMLALFTALLAGLAPVLACAESLALPAGLEEIAAEAFAGDAAITEITVPDGTLRIGDRAFQDCTSLELIHIPDSVTEIGEDAFSGCDTSILEIDCNEGSPAYDYAQRNGLMLHTPVVYRALLIGQSYEGTSNYLSGTIHDADTMASALRLFSGTPYQITRCDDLTGPGILSAISSAFAAADQNDVSLLFYSGHGAQSSSSEYLGALVGVNTGSTSRYVTASQLRARLDTISGKKIVLIDACHSGQMIGKSVGETLEDAAAFNASFIRAFAGKGKSADNLADGSYYVITAALSSQSSYLGWVNSDGIGAIVSFFTYGLAKGMGWNGVTDSRESGAHADANGDGKISVDEAWRYADAVAAEESRSLQDAQVYPEGCTDFYIVSQ